MSDVNGVTTTLTNSVNVCLNVIGEASVNSITGSSLPTQVALAKQTIEEVGRDVQSKGWWFNTSGTDITIYSTDVSDDFSSNIPEEARRYITIRSARVLQSRFIGNEDLHKFSYNEELVSLATLQQAHVRNGGNSTSFSAFPADLKNLGIEEVMFLQGSAEEKLLTLRLSTEIKTQAKITADTSLTNNQASLVSQQTQTEIKETAKREAEKELLVAQELKTDAETTLTNKQGLLVDAQELKTDAEKLQVDAQTALLTAQELKVDKETLDVQADTTLKGKQGLLIDAQELKTDAETTLTNKQGALVDAQELKTDAEKLLVDAQAALTADQEAKTVAEKELLESQKTQLDAQTAITVTEEKAFFDAVVANTQTTYQDRAAEFRMMGIQEKDFYALPAYKKKESISDANKLRTAMATETGTDATEIAIVNNIRRMIGERPITALNGDSMASEAVRMLRKTSTELQGRGWWFNTEVDVEFTADSNGRLATAGMLSVELNEYDTRIKNVSGTKYLYDLKEKSHTSFSGTYKGTVIYERDLDDIPQKFQEYLEVRVAILLTEMYPRDGIDIQRLPRIEKELETYFKDRQNEEGNYNIFDNFDTNARIGINRNYDII